jgi:hypothetical protein
VIKHHLTEDDPPVMSNTDLLPDDLYQESLDIQRQVATGEITVDSDTSCPGS